ncbi:MAG TPA: hypothetical protein VFR27_00160 [Mycobacterium sp.]|nr:hypothetical protein [Mycobacterium sp.]
MRAPWIAGIVAAVAGIAGGVVGALLVGVGLHPSMSASNTESAHSQDVALCTTYALINDTLHHPIETGMDALPAISPLRLALMENPDANPQIRDAISDAVLGFDAILAKGAKSQGLSEPPAYDQSTVNAAFDRVLQVCGLDK